MTDRPAESAGGWSPVVIMPAHNEGSRLPATLRRLFADGELSGFMVLVVCNGCTDDTVARAQEALADLDQQAAVLLDLPEPGKAAAIRTAEQGLPPGPRLVLDADAGCDGRTARLLLSAVDSGGSGTPLADVAVPRRLIVTRGIRNPLVRAYYRVWQDFPWVRSMPSGRAAYALSWELREPLGPFPDLINDDQWATSLVARGDVSEVDATVDVHPVTTFPELLAARSRIYRGNLAHPRQGNVVPGSQRKAVLHAARRPGNWVGLAVFLVVDKLAHRRARRISTGTWTKR